MAAETKLLVFAILTLEGEGGGGVGGVSARPQLLRLVEKNAFFFFNPKTENYLITHNKSSHKRY